MTALGFATCTQGKRVRFLTTTGLVTQLLEARDARTLLRLHKQLERLDLLLLDELGYVPFSKAGAELLFEVVRRAYERTSLLVTTNLPSVHWGLSWMSCIMTAGWVALELPALVKIPHSWDFPKRCAYG